MYPVIVAGAAGCLPLQTGLVVSLGSARNQDEALMIAAKELGVTPAFRRRSVTLTDVSDAGDSVGRAWVVTETVQKKLRRRYEMRRRPDVGEGDPVLWDGRSPENQPFLLDWKQGSSFICCSQVSERGASRVPLFNNPVEDRTVAGAQSAVDDYLRELNDLLISAPGPDADTLPLS